MGILSWFNNRKRDGCLDAFCTLGDFDDLREEFNAELLRVSKDIRSLAKHVDGLSDFRNAQSTVNKHVIDRLQKAGVLPPENMDGDVAVG